ncbi:MAG: mRNA interferase YafQ [Chlamydiae bacterium]|nr:mRNA interferase YafQ [Chlamydiota bacterium]
MLKIKNSKQFKKDLKKYRHQKSVVTEIYKILSILTNRKLLPEKYRDHNLEGRWVNHRECHVKPDVLLIYLMVST